MSDRDNEAARLHELHRYNILFTKPEAAFDRITALAKRLFGAPIVLISLVDEDFQWFKSCIGIDVSTTSREVSFCQHTMTGNRLLVVPDAQTDPRFANNPLVTGPPGIRFYAGAPLITPRGFALGALCIIDTVPHAHGLTGEETETLMDLANIVVSELELRSANGTMGLMKRDLERSNADLARYADVVSHDLQTSIRTVMSLSQLLKRRLTERLNDEERQDIDLVIAAAKRMNELTNSLLTSAQIGDGAMTMESVSLNDVLSSAISDLRLPMEENCAELRRAALPTVRGDRTQLSRLFLNLISNALKYRSPQRAPLIEISCIDKDQRWEIRVRDNGMGIDARYQEQVFEPLRRLHGDDIPGSGLGLTICRSIVHRHGGEISLESQPDVGTTFLVSLPACPVQ